MGKTISIETAEKEEKRAQTISKIDSIIKPYGFSYLPVLPGFMTNAPALCRDGKFVEYVSIREMQKRVKRIP